MKRFYLTAAMLFVSAMSLATTDTANAQLNNVFSNSNNQTSQPTASSSADLSKMLTSTGLKFEEESAGVFLVTCEYEGINLPVYVYKNQSGSMVWVKVNLTKLQGNASQHADKLLSLMELSGSFGEAFYSYNSKTTYLELYSVFRAKNVNESELKTRIETMTMQVIKQRDAWYADEWTVARHVGSWSAGIAANASMTIELRSDGSFNLNNQANGQVTSITGIYQIQDDMLKMKDSDGNEIAGEINFTDGNHFDLSVNNQNLSFERG